MLGAHFQALEGVSLPVTVLEQLDVHKQKKKNLNLNVTPYTKINSKWITNINIK